MISRDWWKENCSWIGSSAVAFRFFYRKGGEDGGPRESKRTWNLIWTQEKQLQKHMKCLSVYGKKKLFRMCMSWNDLKDSLRDISSLRVMQGMGSLDCLKFSSGCKSSWTGGERHWMTPKLIEDQLHWSVSTTHLFFLIKYLLAIRKNTIYKLMWLLYKYATIPAMSPQVPCKSKG
jgi:hypothetical protein